MSLVYAGILSHAPGITGRAHLVDKKLFAMLFMPALKSKDWKLKLPVLKH
ncbi:MAG: hypothetical protein Ct9H300mP22_0400 [Gammaproteobacteria bacterium]|nr:MAG: hypothetical protein Ct9H300mP22_0400 [Gammaproteobacteria bacterium]